MDSTTTEIDLVNICNEIGSISGSNPAYTSGITRIIQKTGKCIEELTINELLQIHRKYNDEFNEFFNPHK